MENFTISLAKLSERINMEVVYTPRELSEIHVEIAEVNRPGLFLAGYYEYFDNLRLQIMGLAEMNFLSVQTAERRYEALDHLFGAMPPAVIVSRSDELTPFPEMIELARKYKVALLRSNEASGVLMGNLLSVLNMELAPRITRHGVLVEVYGEGSWWPTTPSSCARSPTGRSWAPPPRTSATSSSCGGWASSTSPGCTARARSR